MPGRHPAIPMTDRPSPGRARSAVRHSRSKAAPFRRCSSSGGLRRLLGLRAGRRGGARRRWGRVARADPRRARVPVDRSDRGRRIPGHRTSGTRRAPATPGRRRCSCSRRRSRSRCWSSSSVGVPFGLAGVALDGPVAALLSVVIQAIVYIAMIRLLVVDTGALDLAGDGDPGAGSGGPDRDASAGRCGPSRSSPSRSSCRSCCCRSSRSRPRARCRRPAKPRVRPVPPRRAPSSRRSARRSCSGAFATTAWVRGVGVRQGVLRAALVFAAAHVLTTSGTNVADALGLAVVGFGTRVPIALALGWMFVRRRSIWAPFGLHAAFNAWLLVIAEAAARSS